MNEQIELSQRVTEGAEMVELFDSVGGSASMRDSARLMASIEGGVVRPDAALATSLLRGVRPSVLQARST